MSKDSRTYASRREYLKSAVIKRRQAIKARAVALLGGACIVCGYNKHPGVLDFHHVDPTAKSFGISSGGLSRAWATIEAELAKCVLVCANCHREIEFGVVRLEDYLQTGTETVE